jgi:hypothetical protein
MNDTTTQYLLERMNDGKKMQEGGKTSEGCKLLGCWTVKGKLWTRGGKADVGDISLGITSLVIRAA